MDTLTATLIIKGVEPETYEGQVVDAWQHLIDTARDVARRRHGASDRNRSTSDENGICEGVAQ